MAIPTSRTKEIAEIRINEEKCTGCGKCVKVCKDFGLKIINGKVKISEEPLFGCIGCGHCMSICPVGAITIHGRELSPDELFELQDSYKSADYEQLLALLNRRRSIREFTDQPVDNEIIDKIIKAAQTAPMGLPPSDVNVLVLAGKAANHAFAKDFCQYLKSTKWLVSNTFLTIMRPFWGKTNDELFRGFVKPLFKVYTESMARDENMVTYDAPLAMYFYGSPYADPADPIVAATYAMIAGESLGLGTCMLGAVHPLIQHGKQAARFRDKYGIKYKSREGVMVIFGYPGVHYKKGIKRTFASVTRFEL